MPTDKKPGDVLAMIADQMVANSVVKARIEALIDDAVERGDLVATGRYDVMTMFGKHVVADADNKLIFTEPYVAKGDIARPAGQEFSFAFTEFLEARPHLNARQPEPTDLENEAFGEGSETRLKARGELITQHGKAGADLRAQAWGLKDVADFGYGVRPDPNGTAKNDKLSKIKVDRKNNPWSFNGATHEEYAEFIRTRGTAAAREAAAKAGKTIGGQPLPERGTFRRVV